MKEESIINYIKLSNKLNLSNIEDDDAACLVLAQNKFPKIYSGLLTSPGYTPNNELENMLLNSSNATYDYILDLRERDLTKTALNKRQESISKHKIEYDTIIRYLTEQPFAGASLWIQEIDQALQKI
jgi:hypothetical protein